MAIVIDKPGFGEELGTALGGGFSSGLVKSLEGLAQHKFKQLEKQQQQKSSYNSLVESGVEPNDALLLSQFASSPAAQGKLLSGLWERGYADDRGGAGAQVPQGEPGQQAEGVPGQPAATGTTAAPKSSLYKKPISQIMKEEEHSFKKKEVDLKREEFIAKHPAISSTRKQASIGQRMLPYIDDALELLDKTDLTGPALGYLPAYSKEASLMESYLSQIVLDKIGLEQTGSSRMLKEVIRLQELAKANRKMPKSAIKQRLIDLKRDVGEAHQEQSIQDRVLEMSPDVFPKNFETQVRNAQKVMRKLPSAKRFKEGSLGREGGMLFRVRDGEWTYEGKG